MGMSLGPGLDALSSFRRRVHHANAIGVPCPHQQTRPPRVVLPELSRGFLTQFAGASVKN